MEVLEKVGEELKLWWLFWIYPWHTTLTYMDNRPLVSFFKMKYWIIYSLKSDDANDET